jgi:hypothetical protein
MFEKLKRKHRKIMDEIIDKIMDKIVDNVIRSKERALPDGGWSPAPNAGDTLIAHREYVLHTETPFGYTFKDIVSFIEYCSANIDPDAGGIILYTDGGLVGLHDYNIPTGNKVYYNFKLSPELRAWKEARNFSHKMFRKFLEERLDELVDTTIFTALATLKMNTTIHFESDFDDERNHGFVYQEKDGKGSSKIPKEFTIKVPFFVGDPIQEIPLRLNVSQPKDPDSRPVFIVEIIREQRLLVDNIAKLITNLKDILPGHMILHGEI